MDITSHISLIDLAKQFPFEIDESLKEQICFGENLVISCAHNEEDISEDSSDSEWSCNETTTSESSVQVKEVKAFEIRDHVKEESVTEDDVEEEDNFQFYFFPDCKKPKPVKNSKASIITVDGIPKINPVKVVRKVCTCGFDKTGKCTCFTKLPCECGAKVKNECVCANEKEICACHEGKLSPVCECSGSQVCVCYPEMYPRVECVCGNVTKPCLCHRFPGPHCICKHKPSFGAPDVKKSLEEMSVESEFGSEEGDVLKKTVPASIPDPCECQLPYVKPICQCQMNEECICKEDACICDTLKSCDCELRTDKPICEESDSKSVCFCPVHTECTCDAATPDQCKCFPKPVCTCGDPENCKCQRVCICSNPCICDTKKKEEKECICFDKMRQGESQSCDCLRKIDKGLKLKKVRAGKHGYRWCHDVDPRHTYFDYGYGRHDKISYKEQEREKFKILGLYDEKEEEMEAAKEAFKAPPYKKKVRKPSIDCCSAVGGISISVETLGEDKDKFLVQVVSHSSKEGAKTGTKLVSILDCNLHTMEENRTEFIKKNEITKERRSYVAICESGYYNKVTRTCGERNVVKRFYHTFDSCRELLFEGANIVLLRYFGLRRYRGNIKTETLMMDGVVCESMYVCLGVSQAIVNGKPLFVVKVERHIIEPSGCVHQTLTVLSLRGYVISHEWADSNYIMHLNPLLNIVPEKDLIEPHAPLREKWRDDLQLLSDYLEYKSTRTLEGGRFVTENGDLTGVVREYLQTLLLLKPQDALHFTRHYFGSTLSALDLPYDEYFDPSSRHVRYYFFEE